MTNQRGLSAVSVLFLIIIIFIVFMFALKFIPAVTEYISVRHAVSDLSSEKCTSVSDMRERFSNQAIVSNIQSIKAGDIDITKNADGTCHIQANYENKVPLFSHFGFYMAYKFDEVSK